MDKPNLEVTAEPTRYSVRCPSCGLLAQQLNCLEVDRLVMLHECEDTKQLFMHKNIFEKDGAVE